jgi:HK97 family phage major capsid protein
MAERAKIVADQRSMLDKAERGKRALTADENTNYENMDAEVERLTRSIETERASERRKTLGDRERVINGSSEDGFDVRSALYGSGPLHNGPRYGAISEMRDVRYDNNPENREAFRNYLRYGQAAIGPDHFRALQADSDSAGGYLVLPMQVANRIVKAMDNDVFIRRLATVIPCPKAESLGVPTIDNDPGDPTWTAEIATGSEDSTMSFGKRELTPHPAARLIKVSNKLIRASFLDAEAIVSDRLVYKFSIVQENGFLNGSGSNQPMGVFTAATSGFGISTSRDVSTDNTTTSMTADGLVEALFSLKAQYRRKATWIFHRDAVKKIRKLKDGEGNYIWQLGLTADKPDTILNCPYNESEYCPNTFTTGLYVGIVGDFSHYWIADALNMQIQRLVELYAATNQVGFIGRIECDGMPVLEEAFARVTLA